MPASALTLSIRDRLLAALAREGPATTSEVAAAIGTLACWCMLHGHPGVICGGDLACDTCRDTDVPGWRPAFGSDVWSHLRALELVGLVRGERTKDRREVLWTRVPTVVAPNLEADA